MQNLISILIPVYNVQDYIQKCIQSVATQTYKGALECIIVDDCGHDDTINIVGKFIASYQGDIDIRIIHHEHNRGSAAARNTAVENANGEFVVFLDSDDWLESDAIAKLVKKQIETDADIVSGQAIAHYEGHEKLMTEPTYHDKDDLMLHMVEMTIDHVLWRRLIRKSLYTDNGIKCVEGINIGEDHHTLPRLIYYAKKCVQLDEVVYHYNCMNQNSYMHASSKEAKLKRYKSDLASLNILIDFFADKDSICLNRLNEIKAPYIFGFITDCYFNEDEINYNESIIELYSMEDKYVSSVGIKGAWQRFVNMKYNWYRRYNKIKEFFKLN